MTSGMRNIIGDAVLWVSIFIIALAGFWFLDDRIGIYLENRAQSSGEIAEPTTNNMQNTEKKDNNGYGRVVLHAGRSGHFEVTAYINDNSINLLADTGATLVVLTYEDAETLGITYDLEFTGRARTANGVSSVAPVMLDSIQVGDIQVDNVQAIVAREGKLKHSLLGMSFISRLESFQMSGRELVLVQ